MGLGFDKNPNSLTGYGDEGSYGTRKAEGATVAVTKGVTEHERRRALRSG